MWCRRFLEQFIVNCYSYLQVYNGSYLQNICMLRFSGIICIFFFEMYAFIPCLVTSDSYTSLTMFSAQCFLPQCQCSVHNVPSGWFHLDFFIWSALLPICLKWTMLSSTCEWWKYMHLIFSSEYSSVFTEQITSRVPLQFLTSSAALAIFSIAQDIFISHVSRPSLYIALLSYHVNLHVWISFWAPVCLQNWYTAR